MLESLADVHRRLSDLLHALPAPPDPHLARQGVLGGLRACLEGEMSGTFDSIAWQIQPQAEDALAGLPPFAAEVMYHAAREALRNAARHGRGSDPAHTLDLRVAVEWGMGLEMLIEDTGVGVSPEAEPGEGGQGLALHSTLMAIIGGSLAVESLPGRSTRVILKLPAGSPTTSPGG
jgi:signal transduction histidine kinase